MSQSGPSGRLELTAAQPKPTELQQRSRLAQRHLAEKPEAEIPEQDGQ